ncbi:hypothetical protein NO1_0875 [Candidatus Termititenax aidoneus]|uniref:Uncharacterized protein n=1 Tax=Termititenax aidoneus TaxID=2218524 RepID=A0A388TCJ8_TERA1|nr:hypothetical protein NO1_0875 [Candidatus Termititenax aidoneus]
MSDISPVLRSDAKIIPLDSVQTTVSERKELENLRIAAINTAKACNVAYNSSAVNKLRSDIFSAIPAAERGTLRDLDSYILARINQADESFNTAGARELPIQIKFAIYIYGAIQLKHPDYKKSQAIQEVAYYAGAFYQIANAGEAQRQEIIRFAYNTYLGIAKDMLADDDTNLDNVSQVLLFAFNGDKNYKTLVARITGFDAFEGYPGVANDTSAEIRRGADAKYLLDQVLTLLTIAGDDTILRSTRGLAVKNIQDNSDIVNLDSERRLDAADIHVNTGRLAALTPQGNRNWENVSKSNDPDAAKSALAYYRQAEQLLANMQKAGLTPSAVTSAELTAKISDLFNEIKRFFTTLGLGSEGQTATYAKVSEDQTTLNTQSSELERLKNSPYLNLFNDYYGNTVPSAANLKSALTAAERALGLTAVPNATISQRWEKILEAKKAALLKTAETERLRLETEKSNAAASLGKAKDNFNTAAGIYRNDVGLTGAADSAGTAGSSAENAINTYPAVRDALIKAEAAARSAGVDTSTIPNYTTLNDSQKIEKIAEKVLADAERRQKATTDAAAQAETAQTQREAAVAAKQAAEKTGDTAEVQTQAGLAESAAKAAETAARAAEEAALKARNNAAEANRVTSGTPYTAGNPPTKADEQAQNARRAAAEARTAAAESKALINKAQNLKDLQAAEKDFNTAAAIFNTTGQTNSGSSAAAAETAAGTAKNNYPEGLNDALNKAKAAWQSASGVNGSAADSALTKSIPNYNDLNDAQKIKALAEKTLEQARSKEKDFQDARLLAEVAAADKRDEAIREKDAALQAKAETIRQTAGSPDAAHLEQAIKYAEEADQAASRAEAASKESNSSANLANTDQARTAAQEAQTAADAARQAAADAAKEAADFAKKIAGNNGLPVSDIPAETRPLNIAKILQERLKQQEEEKDKKREAGTENQRKSNSRLNLLP